MIRFIKKMFTLKKSDLQFDIIHHLEIKNKKLEDTLHKLKDLEKELRLIKEKI